jgi:hypothetical protein
MKDRLSRAADKNRILRPRSYWVDAKVGFSEAKCVALRDVLAALTSRLSMASQQDILFRAQSAVYDLAAARAPSGRTDDGAGDREAEDQLSALLESARALAQAWAAIAANPRLRGSLDNRLKGLLRLHRDPSGGLADDFCEPDADRRARLIAEQLAARARSQRVEDVMADDLWWLIGQVQPMHAALRDARKIRKSPEYQCVRSIASAWCENDLPVTVTRNNEAAEAAPQTAFQRFLAIAVPSPPIGDKIIREVADELKRALGTGRPRKSSAKSPK